MELQLIRGSVAPSQLAQALSPRDLTSWKTVQVVALADQATTQS